MKHKVVFIAVKFVELVVFIFIENLSLAIGNSSKVVTSKSAEVFLNVNHHEIGIKPHDNGL